MIDLIPIPGFSDPFSSLSHLLGAGVFFILSIPLLRLGWGVFSRFMALFIFTFASIFMLSMSGTYHLLSPEGAGRIVLQRLDHSAIFVLIVGTMTPIHQILFKGFMRWGWLALIWLIAVTSLVLKVIFFSTFPEWLGTVVFICLGWFGAVSGGILWYERDLSYIRFLILGGLAYTFGAIIEVFRVPIIMPGVIRAHELFHVLVLIGLALHWKFIYKITYLDQLSDKALSK